MLGYDAPRWHAAINDLPVALLLAAVVFDLGAAVWKRESLKWAGIWTLWAGVIGGWAAVVAGELAGPCVILLGGGVLAGVGLRVGLVMVVVGFGDAVAASCGQMVSAGVAGGGVRPPSCHTQPSVEPGFGLWVAGPSLA